MGLCVERSVTMVVGVLGILKAGAAYLPLDPTHPQQRLAFVLEDARPQVVLTTESAETGVPAADIRARIARTLEVMRRAIDEGLKGEVRSASGLTGGRARKLWENGPRLLGPRVTETLARAIATLEVNAAMGLIVAVSYFLFVIIGDTLRGNPRVHPELLVWFPNVLFIVLGAFLFRRLARQ